ncbi:hypothetical protein TrST_g5188 [Triparma strigata]|uniref:Uncharacterized protein n=1 Tax=Triparma strigata TaxID=1606541 RepID=A0A9W7EW51_9STRA|nr:hypothetical protein TrST_g5188 [Triparma strigata]
MLGGDRRFKEVLEMYGHSESPFWLGFHPVSTSDSEMRFLENETWENYLKRQVNVVQFKGSLSSIIEKKKGMEEWVERFGGGEGVPPYFCRILESYLEVVWGLIGGRELGEEIWRKAEMQEGDEGSKVRLGKVLKGEGGVGVIKEFYGREGSNNSSSSSSNSRIHSDNLSNSNNRIHSGNRSNNSKVRSVSPNLNNSSSSRIRSVNPSSSSSSSSSKILSANPNNNNNLPSASPPLSTTPTTTTTTP